MRLACVSLFLAIGTAQAQNQAAADEFWPELDVYWKLSQNTRLDFVAKSTRDQDESTFNRAAGIYLDVFVPHFLPIVFRPLTELDDGRMQRIKIRVAYLYNHSFRQTPVIVEHRPFVDGTWAWVFPRDLLATDRNRFEFRIKNGVYSWRYRNQFRLERDVRLAGHAITPFVSAEAFYDSAPGAWNRFRFQAGTVVPFGSHFGVESYFARQITEFVQIRNGNALGLTLNFYVNR
jgi:hypothetical protein